MAEQKTKPTSVRVEDFLNGLEDDQVKKDCFILKKILTELSGFEPRMWGPSIVGFGSYHYKYESGHEGDSCLVGLAPRKQKITLYLAPGFAEQNDKLAKLGKYKTGKGCLYLRTIEDVDLKVLKELIRESISFLKSRYPVSK